MLQGLEGTDRAPELHPLLRVGHRHVEAAALHERATIAKAYCSDALDRIASETIQLHGGIAITWEHDAHLVFKRAHALGQLFGQAHEHRSRMPL